MRGACGLLLLLVGCGGPEADAPLAVQPDAASDNAPEADEPVDAVDAAEAGDARDEPIDCGGCEWSSWCDTTTGQCVEYAPADRCSFPSDETRSVCLTIESEPDVWRTRYCPEAPPEPAGCVWIEDLTCWACRLPE